MRQSGKNNRGRGRNRRNGNGHINRNTTLDSNGPDVRLRGNAHQLYEKYKSLGDEAYAAGERISAEAYFQHADHYFRVHTATLTGSEDGRPASTTPGMTPGTTPEQSPTSAEKIAPETKASAEGAEGSENPENNGEDEAKAKPKTLVLNMTGAK